jgi:hypothetical protein
MGIFEFGCRAPKKGVTEMTPSPKAKRVGMCMPEMPMPKRCKSSKHKGHDRRKRGKEIKLVSGVCSVIRFE